MVDLARRKTLGTILKAGAVLAASPLITLTGCASKIFPEHVTSFAKETEYLDQWGVWHVILHDGMQYIVKKVPIKNAEIFAFAPVKEVRTAQGRGKQERLIFDNMYAPNRIHESMTWSGTKDQRCDPTSGALSFREMTYANAFKEIQEKSLTIDDQNLFFLHIPTKSWMDNTNTPDKDKHYFTPFTGGDLKWKGEAGILYNIRRRKEKVRTLPFYMAPADEDQIELLKNHCTGEIQAQAYFSTLEAISPEQRNLFQGTSIKEDIRANNFYQIQKGETIEEVAKDAEISPAQLTALNPKMQKGYQIYPYDILRIGK